MNFFFSTLFKEPVWVPRCKAEPLVRAANHFLTAYQFLAHQSLEANRPAFSLLPKTHMIQELIEEMEFEYKRSGFCWNIVSTACFQEEDMVGRICFLTRCVSPRNQALRALHRYMARLNICWAMR